MMWTHVPDAALMDVVEGAAGERAEQHVARCARCRARVDEAREALGFAASAAAPEPIASYWEAQRRRVARALVEAPPARSRRPLWAAAAVAGAAAIAVLTVGPAKDPVPAPAPATASAALPAWSPLPEADEDPGLPILALVAPAVATAMPAAVCSDVSECVVGLTDDESQELADALRAQLATGRTL